MKSIAAGMIAALFLAAQSTPSFELSKEERTKMEKELSNWGRWGKDDQIGALNLITPEKRKQAAGLVKEGYSVSLAVDWNTTKETDNPNPVELVRGPSPGTDKFAVSYHGWAVTHLDSLVHVYDSQGRGFNGYTPDKDQVLKQGHVRNSVHEVKNGIVTRGILMDIPRLKGVPYLKPSTPIYAEDLEAWEKMAGVKVQPGDALIVRWGRWTLRKEMGPFVPGKEGISAGLHPSVLKWLKQRNVAILVGESAHGVSPSDGSVHDMAINVLGMQIIDDASLDAVAEAAAARKRWEFLFVVEPLPIPGGTGSPVNPLAIF